jgi:hypothetical protein
MALEILIALLGVVGDTTIVSQVAVVAVRGDFKTFW